MPDAFEAAISAGAESIQAPTKVMDGVCTTIVRPTPVPAPSTDAAADPF